ncbi:MAG: hypothetical protein GC186_14545 [Rhodobacteraceae bacterium]|jgi:hypothetical protein|nr:hypothetical protein [Paracoccaceae bacterium]
MAKKSKISIQIEALRAELWPNVGDLPVWSRKSSDGYTTVPRTLSQIGAIADALSGKGKPLMQTYLELWCRVYDDGFVNLSKQQEIAFSSGFSGQRAVATWRERMKRLKELDFIDIKEGPSGPLSYALMFNPYWTVAKHKAAKTANFPQDRYSALFERALEIGASDLAEYTKAPAQ